MPIHRIAKTAMPAAATLGILYLQPSIHRLITPQNYWLQKIWTATTLSIAAQVATLPLTLYYFKQFRARVDTRMLLQHLTNPILHDLCRLSLALGYPKTYLKAQLISNVQINQAVCLCPGAKDLMEGSAFLCEVKKWLPDEKVPILMIGGGQNDFGALLTKKKVHRFKALNNIYTFFILGDQYPNGRHDM